MAVLCLHWLAYASLYFGLSLHQARDLNASIHSTLPPGAEFTVVEFKIDLLRSITVDTGDVKAEGAVAKVGRQLGWANGVLSDKDGNVLAKGTTTCLIRQPAGD